MGTSISQVAAPPTEEALKKDQKHVEAHSVVFKKAVDKAPDPVSSDLSEFEKFREELFSFSLGESAFDYSERLYAAQPHNPQVMALLAETATMYDKAKNKQLKPHWVDRMDLLQRAIDVSRQCIKENPEYGPCYRTYVLAACRASENLYYYRWMRGMGLTENYAPIMKKARKAVELCPQDAALANAIGCLNGRCSQFYFFPYILYNWYYKLPSKKELLAESIHYHKTAVEKDPSSLEYMHRLGMAYYQDGQLDKARRCFYAVRDEMVPKEISDQKWQNAAHTILAGGFDKNKKWNVPFA